MSAPTSLSKPAYASDSDSDGQARVLGQLLKGATDENGAQKSAALLVGIKLDLEAEVHLTARVKGDIVVGLY
uniref:Uncharacterized protein n=1 Tax=Fusarium oxysporum (strain Fo5176) TaxID=660025 RepID=A0A0D2XW62_FUSOF